MTSKDYYFDSYAHFGIHEVRGSKGTNWRDVPVNGFMKVLGLWRGIQTNLESMPYKSENGLWQVVEDHFMLSICRSMEFA